MAASQIISEDVDSWETLMFLYNSALKEVGTKLDILNDEFVHIHKYNPIEYIKKRIHRSYERLHGLSCLHREDQQPKHPL